MKSLCLVRASEIIGLILCCSWLVVSSTLALADTLPELTGRVVDNANLLTSQQREELSGILADFEQRSGGKQFVVATIPSLNGENQFDYSLRLFKAWQLGQKDKNNGALLFIARDDRKISIRTGYGLESTLTDQKASAIIQDFITPAFKQKKYYQGIREGLLAMMRTADPNYVIPTTSPSNTSSERSSTGSTSPTSSDPRPESANSGLAILGAFMGGVLGCLGLVVALMVWIFKSGKRCPQCQKTTYTQVSNVVLSPATYASSGYGVRTKQCSTCGFQNVENYDLPMLVETVTNTSSYSSSDSGFSGGGGDSGGGGADSSW